MALGPDARNYLVRKWFLHELGREPKPAEQADRSEQIVTAGLDLTFAAIVDSPEAQAFRKRRGW